MIVQFPTGLYKDAIPREPNQRGSVTFTISNRPPPRSNLVFPKVPLGLIERKRTRDDIKTIGIIDNRKHLGELIFTVSRAARQTVGNNARQYEIGQILDFNDMRFQTIQPMLVAEVTEVRHDTNTFDFDAMGVSEDEKTLIAESSLVVQETLMDRLNDLKRRRADAEQVVAVQQRAITETTKTIAALEVVREQKPTPQLTTLLEKLYRRRDAAFVIRDKAMEEANKFAADAESVLAELRSVAVVVK